MGKPCLRDQCVVAHDGIGTDDSDNGDNHADAATAVECVADLDVLVVADVDDGAADAAAEGTENDALMAPWG